MFEVTNELVGRIEEVLGRGLCKGKGDPSKQMCVEAAVCFAMGLPHGDNPPCVGGAVRIFKMTLNDSRWSSDLVRAGGVRKIAIAQLGSNTLGQIEFARRLSEKTIRILIPTLFREVFKDNEACLKAADLCEISDTLEGAARADYAAYAADYAAAAAYGAARAATYAARGSADASAARAAYAAGAVARVNSDKYLILSAELCFQVLDEMNSPGAVWMRENNWQ